MICYIKNISHRIVWLCNCVMPFHSKNVQNQSTLEVLVSRAVKLNFALLCSFDK